MSFDQLGMSSSLIRALSALGYTSPFPVQSAAIPAILQGGDIAVQAQTGSGKTVAFLVPILQTLCQTLSGNQADTAGRTRVLVLVPTRELAVQIAERAIALVKHLPLVVRIRLAYGGVSINPQMLALRGGTDVLIATPGRLLDLVAHHAVHLDAVSCLVLDEADKMLDHGFAEEMEQIRQRLPAKRQNLLFSATMSTAVKHVVAAWLQQAQFITIEAQAGLKLEINEMVYLVTPEGKGPFLRELLQTESWSHVLVFVGSARRADNVVRKLANNGIAAMALHGDKSQSARTEALRSFRGSLRVLVATDILSRGIDVSELPCVINYELPRSARDYTHRIGRTGRAGQAGTAISLVCPDEEAHLALIEKTIRRKLPRT